MGGHWLHRCEFEPYTPRFPSLLNSGDSYEKDNLKIIQTFLSQYFFMLHTEINLLAYLVIKIAMKKTLTFGFGRRTQQN